MFPQTVRQRDYIFNCLGARRDGSIDVKERHIRSLKVPCFRAFRASDRQRQKPDQAVKTALSEHINRIFRRVE